MPALVAGSAVTHAGTAVGFDLGVLGVTRWATSLTSQGKTEVAPIPVWRLVKAVSLEELPCDIPLHIHVTALGAAKIGDDDIQGRDVVSGVGDLNSLARLGGQPYHLLW